VRGAFNSSKRSGIRESKPAFGPPQKQRAGAVNQYVLAQHHGSWHLATWYTVLPNEPSSRDIKHVSAVPATDSER
jgi:hypothetical protein